MYSSMLDSQNIGKTGATLLIRSHSQAQGGEREEKGRRRRVSLVDLIQLCNLKYLVYMAVLHGIKYWSCCIITLHHWIQSIAELLLRVGLIS